MATRYTTVEEVLGSMGRGRGIMVALAADSGSAQLNPDRIYIDAKDLAKFEVGQEVSVAKRTADDDLGLFEIGRVLSKAATYLVLETNLTLNYVILVDNPCVFTTVDCYPFSSPSYNRILEWIKEAEDEVDKRTHITWSERYDVEYRAFSPQNVFNLYPQPLVLIPGTYDSTTYYRTELRHRKVKELNDTASASYEGDYLKVWVGGKWEEWVNAAEPGYVAGKVEGRGKDYWVDYENGTLFFNSSRPQMTDMAIKIRYRYGESLYEADLLTGEEVDVPGNRDIRKAACMIVQARLLMSERYAVNFPGGDDAGAPTPGHSAQMLLQEVQKILDVNTELIGYFGEM